MESYSQLGQDLNVLQIYNNKKNGFFIEIGASDGIELSNTYLLEKNYNWNGICIEPLPERFNKLHINRPHSICINKAVFNETGKRVEFCIAHNSDLLSGLPEYLGPQHIPTIRNNMSIIEVDTITLNDVLKNANAPFHIDYLSLDTEGTELEILKNVDLSIYSFGLIDVEHNYLEPNRTNIRDYLTSNGYVFLRQNQFDDSYIHNSLVKNR
jgi:FkbM family methyltransferase